MFQWTDLTSLRLIVEIVLLTSTLKRAIEESSVSFSVLKIKVRKKILADGLDDETFDVTDTGKHLSAKEFNEAMDQEGTIVVDLKKPLRIRSRTF